MEPFENASKRPEISSLTFAQEEPAQKKRKQSGKEADERSEWAVKKSETLKKDETKSRKVKVEHMPMSVLEKIFAFLDWTDKGRALLVCQRWKTVGGNPFLWSEFPLHLADHKLVGFNKIHRLQWVKSVTVSLPSSFVSTAVVKAIVDELPCLEELFVNIIDNTEEEKFWARGLDFFVKANNNRLLRIGINMEPYGEDSDNTFTFFISSCDTNTSQFLKKSLAGKKVLTLWLYGLDTGDDSTLTIELLKSICLNTEANGLNLITDDLIFGKNMDLPKLLDIFKRSVAKLTIMMRAMMSARMRGIDKTVDLAPYNSLLGLLNTKHHGVFRKFELERRILLRSDFVDQLGGAEAVRSNNQYSINTFHTDSGLGMFDPRQEIEECGCTEENEDEGEEDEDGDEHDGKAENKK